MGIFAKKYNHNVQFDVNFDFVQWTKPADLYKEDPKAVYRVRYIGINNKGQFGPQPTVIVDNEGTLMGLSLPQHCLEEVKEMLGDQEAVEAIKAGACGIKFYQYEYKRGASKGTAYGVNWLDIEPDNEDNAKSSGNDDDMPF